jgi:hypothetical protein
MVHAEGKHYGVKRMTCLSVERIIRNTPTPWPWGISIRKDQSGPFEPS